MISSQGQDDISRELLDLIKAVVEIKANASNNSLIQANHLLASFS